MTRLPKTQEGTRHTVATGARLTHDQIVKCFELVPAMVADNGYQYPAVLVHETGVAQELVKWMTSDDFYRSVGGV